MLFAVIFWLLMSVIISYYALRLGKFFPLWFFISLFSSPMMAGIFLALSSIRDLKK